MKQKFNLQKTVSPLLIITSFLCIIFISSCVEDVFEGDKEENQKSNDFDFSPIIKSTLKINYDLKGKAIPFQIYLINPMKEFEGGMMMDSSIQPYFAGYTDKNGLYSEEFNPPSSIKAVYLCTQQFGLPSCVKIKVTGTDIVFDMSLPLSKNTASKAGLNPLNGFLHLGGWDNTYGVPDYLLARTDIPANLMNEIRAMLPEVPDYLKIKHPELFKENIVTSVNIKEKAKLNLVFMHEGATMGNMLAYYHYPTGHKPATKEEIKNITIAFPNCSFKYEGGGLSSGDQILLKYWNGKEFENEFPAGTTIEWVFLTSAFKPLYGGLVKDPLRTFYSTPQFNSEYTVQLQGELQRSIALYDAKRKLVAIGFEDTDGGAGYRTGGDFNDVVFTVHSTPDSAIDGEGMPVLPPTDGETDTPVQSYTQSGTLAFEDLWPNQGDYDMNDVIVGFTSTVHIAEENMVIKLEDKITAIWSGGSISSGFGYQLNTNSSSIKSCIVSPEMTTTGKNTAGVETGQDKATIILFDDIHKVIDKTFTVTTVFEKPIPQKNLSLPPYNPFIIVGENKGENRKEVHLSNFTPTKLADKSLLGTSFDLSDPSRNKYYISTGNFPFAIHIPLSFNIPKEGVRIDISYPDFSEWVESNGTKNQDWYLNPKKEEVIEK